MKKVFIRTYGCSFNQADSENMAGLLDKSGKYSIVDSENEADLVIINSCTVKNSAEAKFWRDVKKISKPKILAGCVPQAERDKTKFSGYSVIGTSQINQVVEAADETLNGNTVHLLRKRGNPRLNIPKVRKNSKIEIVPINEGCLGSCDFCMTKFARGHLKSYNPEDISRHIREALNDGVMEIWLTSQDTACYGFDLGTNIVALLRKIFSMKRDFHLRLGMGNPDHMGDYLDELIDVYSDPRMFKFLHIPVQSGSDRVLKNMKREYTVMEFCRIVERFKAEIPDLTLSTDIICGYPGEGHDDFEGSLDLVRRIKPDVLNISRYWARPGTIAAMKKQLPGQAAKSRSIILTKLFEDIAFENNKNWRGWSGYILIDENGKYGTFVGRNFAYKPVVVKGDHRIGDIVQVTVTDSTKHDLRARLCADYSPGFVARPAQNSQTI